MRTVTDSQLKILKALGRYMFLTVQLIDTLQIFQNKISIYRSIKPLKEGKRPLLISKSFGIHPIKGQLPALLYLSKYGKELLMDYGYDESKIKLPINKTLVSTDYYHRVSNLTFFVKVDLLLKSNSGHIIFLDYYFSKAQKQKNQKFARAKNRIDLDEDNYIIPDIVLKFNYHQNNYIYLVEIHNGNNSNKCLTQIINHIKAIDLGTPRKKYNHPRNNRVVFIFEYESCMKSIMKKMEQDSKFTRYINLFLFNTIKNMNCDFGNNWLTFKNRRCNLI